MALPGLKTNARGKFLSAGDMLIFVAGNPPIYGRQVPYFIDLVLMERAKIPPPQKTAPAISKQEDDQPQSESGTVSREGAFVQIPYGQVLETTQSNPTKGEDDDNPEKGN